MNSKLSDYLKSFFLGGVGEGLREGGTLGRRRWG